MPQVLSRVVVGAAAYVVVAVLLAVDGAGQSTTITITNQQPPKSTSSTSSASTPPEAAAKISPDTPIVPLSEIQTRSFASRNTLADGGPQQQQQPTAQQPSAASSTSSSSIPQPAKQLMSTKSEVWTASAGRSGGRGKYPSSMVPEENVPFSRKCKCQIY